MIRNRLKRMIFSVMIALAIFALVGCSGAETDQGTTNDESNITDNGIANTDRIEEKNAGTSP